MFLKKPKFRSNCSRHSLLNKNFLENFYLSGKIIFENKKLGLIYRKKKSFCYGKNILGPCKLDLQPVLGAICGGIKTISSSSYPYGIFFNNKSIFFNNMVKGLDFFKKYITNYTFLDNSDLYNNKFNSFVYSNFLKYGVRVFCIYNQDYSIMYKSSSGNYITHLSCFKKLGFSLFRFPSMKKFFISNLSLCHIGRNIGIFMKYRVFGNFKFYTLKKKKFLSTRGVAMNPVDHPNGGRSKSKTPFYNKYNKLAKRGK